MNDDFIADHYEDLQVSPNADQETIERVYRLLAKRYHPDNGCSGCVDKFDMVTKAYGVLSDPAKRAAFDARYEQIRNRKWKLAAASRPSLNGNGNRDQEIRNAVLSVLYIERRNDPSAASVGLWQLEKILGWPEKILEFHTWYLKEKGWIQRTDSGGHAITVVGIDVLEENGLMTGKDLLLPEPEPSGARKRNANADEPPERLGE
jgi:curved DNA-binding protein CbpA